MSETSTPRFGGRDTLRRIERHLARHSRLYFPTRIEFDSWKGARLTLNHFVAEPRAHRPLAEWASSLATIDKIELHPPTTSDRTHVLGRLYAVKIIGRLGRVPSPMVTLWDILPLDLDEPMYPADAPRELSTAEWSALLVKLELAA
ncbi:MULTISPECIES: hypothetical protein [unclassified Crossiella]|uniref:hypothetical protein n=1 Tax=unclassified Crossiella TaxID=2620835 RepID=UPI001FFE4E7D|nr:MULTISPECIES: hypothetical protein [unclassified Crossiella]MCK2242181.1 hypothetical protein [Crossiella sp. S99.2]MCK2256084.1 hypothetical protein [Crossiella sp. S99.1]